jgi:hypothetical protein
MQDEENDDDGWGNEFSDNEQNDDDDTAWKVRKSSVKVIDALV